MNNNGFRVRMYDGDKEKYSRAPITAYYCSGETLVKDQDLCVNLPDNKQLVIDVASVIKLLKKHNRI